MWETLSEGGCLMRRRQKLFGGHERAYINHLAIYVFS